MRVHPWVAAPLLAAALLAPGPAPAGPAPTRAAEDRADAVPAAVIARRYRVSVRYFGTYRAGGVAEWQAPDGTGRMVVDSEVDEGFVGRSAPFWVVRSGPASHPSYTIASDDGDPLMVTARGAVAYSGRGHYALTPDPARWASGVVLPPACAYDETYALRGDMQADFSVTLVRNRLGLALHPPAARFVNTSPVDCGYEKPRSWVQSMSPDWSRRLTPGNVRYVTAHLGRWFGFTKVLDGRRTAGMRRTFTNRYGGTTEYWTSSWKLDFTPA